MKNGVETIIEASLGESLRALRPLTGGCVAEVYRVETSGGRKYVAKVDMSPAANLSIEGFMLRYLRDNTELPVPGVVSSADELLIMEYIAHDSVSSSVGERQAARKLAALHSLSSASYGFERDTLIGPLHQPNPWTNSWVEFFTEHRVLYMADLCVQAGRMAKNLRGAIEELCAKLPEYLDEPQAPSLIHGDVWSGNVLYDGGHLRAFIDPAIYFADAEMELAFTTLFTTFTDDFYDCYQEIRPIRPGFWDVRKDLYNLYPLLVHVRLFGGSYLRSVERIVTRFTA